MKFLQNADLKAEGSDPFIHDLQLHLDVGRIGCSGSASLGSIDIHPIAPPLSKPRHSGAVSGAAANRTRNPGGLRGRWSPRPPPSPVPLVSGSAARPRNDGEAGGVARSPTRLNVDGLGPVEIHRELMTAAARWIMAEKLRSVLSLRMAMRLNSLSLQKKFSMRCRHL